MKLIQFTVVRHVVFAGRNISSTKFPAPVNSCFRPRDVEVTTISRHGMFRPLHFRSGNPRKTRQTREKLNGRRLFPFRRPEGR